MLSWLKEIVLYFPVILKLQDVFTLCIFVFYYVNLTIDVQSHFSILNKRPICSFVVKSSKHKFQRARKTKVIPLRCLQID